MRLYATAPARRTRQLAADLSVLAWVVAWVLVGRWVHALVMTLAAPAAPLRDAGTGLRSRMTDVAERIGEVPLVGGSLDAPFTGTAAVGDDLITAGDRLEGAVRVVATLVSLLTAGVPILLVLLAWLLLRLAWVRRAAALGRELQDPRSHRLLALRALVRQHPRRLQRLYPDPVAAYESGDPEVWRALADLELAQVGLRTPAPRNAPPPAPGEPPAAGSERIEGMKTLIIALLVLWLLFAVLGAVIEGLLWLLWIGILLFVGTVAWGLLAARRG